LELVTVNQNQAYMETNYIKYDVEGKGKDIPVTGHGGP
jgi:hypothetical protein